MRDGGADMAAERVTRKSAGWAATNAAKPATRTTRQRRTLATILSFPPRPRGCSCGAPPALAAVFSVFAADMSLLLRDVNMDSNGCVLCPERPCTLCQNRAKLVAK